MTRVLLFLSAGIISVSLAAVLIRLADAPALVTAAYRMAIAAALLAPGWWLGSRRGRGSGGAARARRGRDRALVLAAGVALAAHFGLWIASLSRTSVASSVALVAMNPLFVALFARLFLQEKLSRRVLAGMAVAIAGSALIGGADFRADLRALGGDALALGGAVMGALYMVAGRALRERFRLATYVLLVYGTAALALVGMALLAGAPLTGYPADTYLYFTLLAVLPQLVGHTSFNYALRFLPASIVSVVILSEPVGATILAWWILAERPGAWMIAGGSLVLSGVLIAIWPRRTPGRGPSEG